MRVLIYIIFLVLIHQLSFGQEDIDAAFKQVKQKAENKEYNDALEILNALEQKYDSNEDVRVYQGRIYSWKKDFTNAKKILSPLTEREKPNMEALESLINVYYWSYDYEACMTCCNKYLEIQPEAPEIIIIKVVCLEKSGRNAEALAILEKLPLPYNTSEKVNNLKTIISRKKKNAIAASYLNISTYDPGESPTHYGYIEYLRKFTRSTLIGRANIGYRYGESEGQFEVDYYQTFHKGYLYTNVGISNGEVIFPKTRLGIEYYFAPQSQFDFSLGGRYMHFEDEDVALATGQVAYKLNKYTLAYRPYYDIENNLWSHTLSLQKYDENKENLIKLEAQYGTVPYLYIYSNSAYSISSEPLRAYRAGIQYQRKFSDSFFIRPVFLYEYEEYYPSSYRHKFNCQMIFTKRF